MWSREQLKSKAKMTFTRNYWKCILVSLLLAIVAGGAAGSSAAFHGRNAFSSETQEGDYDEWGNYIGDGDGRDAAVVIDEYELRHPAAFAAFFAVFFSVFMVVFVVALGVAIVLDVLICNPVAVGCSRFYLKNLEGQAQVKEAVYAFDHSYKNIVSTMFFRDLYTVLWSLLFIIPGIVKSYEYQMIPYLLAENPQMTREQAFAESKRMMDGNKWRAFVLDLSFLGWEILSVFTFGILNIFYVQPYMDATHAALYEALRYNTPMGGQPAGKVYMQEDIVGE